MLKENNEELIKMIEAEGVLSEEESRQEFKDRTKEEKQDYGVRSPYMDGS